jgi:hypothetical protein
MMKVKEIKMGRKTEEPERRPQDILESIVPKEKRDAIGRDAKWAAIGIALVSFIGQQFFLNMEFIKVLYPPFENFFKPEGASLGDYITIWNTLAVSAPLVLVISVMYVYGAEKLQKKEGFAPGHYLVGGLLLWGAALVGNTIGFTPVKTEGPRGGTPFAWMGLMLGDYFNSYGFILFGSSLIVGILMGRAWNVLTTD